ncbi:hypothetical protein A2U01_0041479, partial [Trifolium medium]|nr:hypothetical protein [Trifolium medium]
VPFFARPDPTEPTPQVLPIPSFETSVIPHKPPQPQTGPEFKRYVITYERKRVKVPDTVPTVSNDSVEETAPPLSDDSD